MSDESTNRPGWGRDPDRIPMILAALAREWRKQPDTRLGQLLVNLLREHEHPPREQEGMRLFAIPDGVLLSWLGPETDAERTYIEEEPRLAREGWAAWEKSFRESDAYKEWRRGPGGQQAGDDSPGRQEDP